MKVQEFFDAKPTVILDGAMGSELQKRGYDTALPLWSAPANLEAPGLVKQIHQDYIKAGADIITTNTFRTIRHTYQQAGNSERAVDATLQAVKLAKQVAAGCDRQVLVAGSVSTLEDCYSPELVPEEQILQDQHTFQVNLLAAAGVDLILAETLNTLKEAAAIASAAVEAGMPFIVSFVTDGEGNLLGGEPLALCAERLTGNPLAVMLNCRSLITLDNDLQQLRDCYKGHIGVYANGYGNPDDEFGWTFEDSGQELKEHVDYLKKWHASGMKVMGGCCGTSPVHIAEIAKMVSGKTLPGDQAGFRL